MKPNFALDLTHDGIGLLHRGKGGWLLAGEINLDDPELMARLGMMRQTAVDLESGGFASQLILPPSQVLFTTMTAPGPDKITREARIREGLEGLTPYAVDDLIFDWYAHEDMAHVAVIARETLAEAEGFAFDNRLNPVSFSARPHGSFGRPAFFGPTSCADQFLRNGANVQADRDPIPALMGTGVVPIAPPEPASPPAMEPVDITAKDAAKEPIASTHGPVITKNEEDIQGATARTPVESPVSTPKLAPFPPDFEPEDDGISPGLTPPKQVPITIPPTTPNAPNKPASTPAHATPKGSERKPSQTKPKLSGAKKPHDAPQGNSTALPGAPPAFSTRRSTDAQTETGKKSPLPGQNIQSRILVAPPSSGIDVGRPTQPQKQTHMPVTAPTVVGEKAEGDTGNSAPDPAIKQGAKAATAGANAAKRKLKNAARKGRNGLTKGISGGIVGAAGAAGAASALASRTAKALPKRSAPPAEKPPAKIAPHDTSIAGPVPSDMSQSTTTPHGRTRKNTSRQSMPKEADALTIFGARAQQNVGGKPKFLALFLILGLLLLFAIVAVWSMFFLSEQTTDLFSGREDQFESAITTGPTTTTGDTIASAPNLDSEQTDQFSEFDPDSATDFPASDPRLVETDQALAPAPLSSEAAETRYAATGIWERAPDPLTDPEAGRIDGLYVASIDPKTSGHDAVALPSDRLAAFENAPSELLAPPPSGTRFDLDERGLVRATPQGSLTPEGVLVIAGRPNLVPAERPGGAGPEAVIVPETSLPSIRPRTRPEGLIESNERQLLGGRSRAELAGLRPAPRPQSIVALTEQAAAISNAVANAAIDDAAAAAAASVVAPTELAVARSPEPKSRPKGFQKLVDAARAADASDGSVVVAAAPRNQTVTPKIPTRASVAKQATVKNGISLRKVSLIGIYGSSSKRRALVRLPSGRYVKVGIGDRLNGGKVISISESKLIYKKGSRTNTLKILPFG